MSKKNIKEDKVNELQEPDKKMKAQKKKEKEHNIMFAIAVAAPVVLNIAISIMQVFKARKK